MAAAVKGTLISKSGVDLERKARELGPLIADHADAAERERRVPMAVIDALASAGIFHMFVPQVFGGGETDLASGVRVLEELSKADGSTGWVAMIGATTGVISAYMPEHVSREVYRPGVITGGVVAPRGTAVPEGDGYLVNGRWPFASGCEHSRWLACACMVREQGERGEQGEQGEVRMALFPASVVEIIDTWHVSGLRGTGSHDIAVSDALVPADYSYSMSSGPVQAGVLYGFSLMGLLSVSVAAVALGIGRAALDEIREMAPKKTPVGRRKPLSEWSVAQVSLAEGEGSLRAGRALLFEAVAGMWGTLERGEQPSRGEGNCAAGGVAGGAGSGARRRYFVQPGWVVDLRGQPAAAAVPGHPYADAARDGRAFELRGGRTGVAGAGGAGWVLVR